MNFRAVYSIYYFEMARFFRTITQSLISPVLSTSLYFIVFGTAIGSRIQEVEGISYGAFIVPGLIMLSVLQQSISNASFGIYFPKFIGSVYEVNAAPVSFVEIDTDRGHDAFLLEEPNFFAAIEGFVSSAARARGLDR